MSLFIGLMSGTSMDGIDAALVEMPTHFLLGGLTRSYSDEVRRLIDELIAGKNLTLAGICQLNTLIGREFAAAANELLKATNTSAKKIIAVGSHGQTVCHNTNVDIPYTLQLGCGHTISSLTGITVVADFRSRDIANGGQGAPFAPLYHQQLFLNEPGTIAIVNIGGIANVSFVSVGQSTSGWDMGPGNCLMDAWILSHQNKKYDEDGAWAKQGKVIPSLLDDLLSDSFLKLATPKSIGKEYYSLLWLKQYLKPDFKPVDVQATLAAYTAHTIAQTILAKGDIEQLYLCGGGVHNKLLNDALADLLPGVSVKSSIEQNINPDYLEAMMFAWLAFLTINHLPVNLKSITGSMGLNILGAVYPILK